MIKLDSKVCQAAFDSNWHDWCLGGPHPDGYTRVGDFVPYKPLLLTGHHEAMVLVDDVLSKNRNEVERWHLEFLDTNAPTSQTQYFQEYLLSRFEEQEALRRATQFKRLFQRIAQQGVLKRVWVAETDLVRCFRFDGCHRACCAKSCGITHIPAFVFSTEYV